MEMMFAINEDNFDSHRVVTCYSCHRGSDQPIANPTVMSEEPKEMAGQPGKPDEGMSAAKENSGPSADQLIDKYLQASGGAAIDKVTSRVMKGTIDFSGKSLPIDIYNKAPDERISLTHMPDGDNVTAFNGHEGGSGRQIPFTRNARWGPRWRVDRRRSPSAYAFEADVHRNARPGR